MITRVSRGNASAENVASGYMYLAGGVVELDWAIGQIEEILFGRGVPEANRDKPFDPYGVA